MLYPGQAINVPFYVTGNMAASYSAVIAGQDLSTHTIKFKVWQYSGAGLDINATVTATYSAPDTTLSVALTATDTALGYARGFYSFHNETTDLPLMVGELIVEAWPYS